MIVSHSRETAFSLSECKGMQQETVSYHAIRCTPLKYVYCRRGMLGHSIGGNGGPGKEPNFHQTFNVKFVCSLSLAHDKRLETTDSQLNTTQQALSNGTYHAVSI